MISKNQLDDTEVVDERELLPANQTKGNPKLPLIYVTASVNYDDFHPNFTIGDGGSSIDPISQMKFYNIPLQKHQKYYYFVRVYSKAHTKEVSCTELSNHNYVVLRCIQ